MRLPHLLIISVRQPQQYVITVKINIPAVNGRPDGLWQIIPETKI